MRGPPETGDRRDESNLVLAGSFQNGCHDEKIDILREDRNKLFYFF